jgi:hypothetical protein
MNEKADPHRGPAFFSSVTLIANPRRLERASRSGARHGGDQVRLDGDAWAADDVQRVRNGLRSFSSSM